MRVVSVLITVVLTCDMVTYSSTAALLNTTANMTKIGRKERCRHVVRQEVRKYSARVKDLSDMVRMLQEDIQRMVSAGQDQQREIADLQNNASKYQALLSQAISRIEALENPVNSLQKERPPQMVTETIRDCHQVYKAGMMKYSGTYQIQIQPERSSEPFHVLCEPLNDAGWLIIQNRYDGSESFHRNWHDYKKGFGNLQREFWLGNEKIHHLTSQGVYTLRFELEEFSGRKHWAEYALFSIDSNADNYKLRISGYSGNAGDALSEYNGTEFSTYDADHDFSPWLHCAKEYGGGWWYNVCSVSNINGRYQHEGNQELFFSSRGLVWKEISSYRSLKASRMMIKPASQFEFSNSLH